MKKTLASIFIIGAFSVYALYLHSANSVTASSDSTTASTQTVTQTDTTQSQTGSTNTGTQTTAQTTAVDTPKGQYKNGTYTGSSENAFYGNIQVKATVSGGKLTDVTFLTYPNDRGDSVEINQHAMPILSQEAIQAQSAQVDGVTGATDTSEAFVRSLSSALSQAKA